MPEFEIRTTTQQHTAAIKMTRPVSQIGPAMAEAFRAGNLGIMDYYRMKNIQADTDMRKSLGEGTGDDDENPNA